ncbi:MAG: NUDIX domain-containing protein [Deltaproteobacteria bacterium]|nr:NUDIX domain-containing protein [Deltaproteobacteria bacterium]
MSAPAPLRVVAGVLLRGEEVLLAQRPAGKRQALLWELPGGKVEPGEGDAEALERELLEELGVVVRAGEVLAEVRHRYEHGVILLIAMRCELLDGTPQALEHAALAWAAPAAFDDYALAPADRPLLDKIVTRIRVTKRL